MLGKQKQFLLCVKENLSEHDVIHMIAYKATGDFDHLAGIYMKHGFFQTQYLLIVNKRIFYWKSEKLK